LVSNFRELRALPDFGSSIRDYSDSDSYSSSSCSSSSSDVIKTRLQVAGGNTSVVSVIKTLVHERGYIGLTAGWWPRILAVAPGATVMMTCAEFIKRYCAKD
jgi:hypothetical protein